MWTASCGDDWAAAQHLNADPSCVPPPCCSLAELERLEELYLLGNPCARWQGYRPYVLGTLPRLRSLDGEPVGARGGAAEGLAMNGEGRWLLSRVQRYWRAGRDGLLHGHADLKGQQE